MHIILPSKNFQKEVKQLLKKYPSLLHDLETLTAELRNNPYLGTSLGQGLRKVRLAISDKHAGKRGGARVITHNAVITIEENVVTLLSIYDKSQEANISIEKLKRLLAGIKNKGA